ncbi:4-carboxymuconolactone decarboxylase [Talaromyces pinophilus]|nr:4-carboxymuconolactone decarboxylase [Talaromyces pinophilus]
MSTNPKHPDIHKDLFDEVNGSTEFSRAGQELVTEFCWGYAWTRPGLGRKQRSLMNNGILMALNRGPELAVHVRGAIRNGLTETEVREAILHATTYTGVAVGVEGMKITEKVLNEMAEKGEHVRDLGKKVEL